jgi:hypothetical protein
MLSHLRPFAIRTLVTNLAEPKYVRSSTVRVSHSKDQTAQMSSEHSQLLYDNRAFRSTSNSGTGEVSSATIFHYHQSSTRPHIVWAEYSGGSIVQGNLIATVARDNVLDMRYHHVNDRGELMTGQCESRPEVLEDGRLRMHEKWRWTGGGQGEGESIIEEVSKGSAC